MKCKKGSHKRHLSAVGPSLIVKRVDPDDSFARLVDTHNDRWQWSRKINDYRTDAIWRDDPFGADDYIVPFSMDKKRRWIVPDIVRDEIESVQDPSIALRVSVAVQTYSRTDVIPHFNRRSWGGSLRRTDVDFLPTQEYHDVLRDGTVKHKDHKHASLMTLERDPKPKRPRKRVADPADDWAGANLPYDEEALFQKVHVRYNVITAADDKRVHPYMFPKFRYSWMYEPNLRDPKFSELEGELRDLEEDLIVDDDDEVIASSTSGLGDLDVPVERTLADCIIPSRITSKERRRFKKSKKCGDEIIDRVSFPDVIDEEDFEVIEHPTIRLTINPNFRGTETGGDCPICMDPFSDRSPAFSLGCDHIFCRSCWLQHIAAELEKGKEEVPCMNLACSATLSQTDAKTLLSPESYSLYQSMKQELSIKLQKARRCPQCHWILPYSGSSVEHCSCGADLCGLCPSLVHLPLNCQQVQQYWDYLKKNGIASLYDIFPTLNVANELVRCPSCATPMQRSAGCDHMTCVCGVAFCYICGKERDWAHDQGGCNKKELESMVLLDVFSSNGADRFAKKYLEEAVRFRTELAVRRREIIQKLCILPLTSMRMYMRKIAAISLQLEANVLRTKDSHIYRRNASLIELALYRFLNMYRYASKEGNVREELKRKADRMIVECYKITHNS